MQENARATGGALASPFVCYSRVTSRDSSKWRACSRAFFEVARETGSVSCRIVLWDCLGDAIAAFIGHYGIAQKTGPRIFVPKNSPMVQFDTPPTQSHAQSNVSSSKDVNRPLPSSKNPHFQNEARCTTFLVKMSFICMKMKNHFHIKG